MLNVVVKDGQGNSDRVMKYFEYLAENFDMDSIAEPQIKSNFSKIVHVCMHIDFGLY